MEQYTRISYAMARTVTLDYSTSFSKSSRLFGKDIRKHIYAIYGLVRVADEVVDTYRGKDVAKVIKELEAHTMQAMKSGFSPNPLVHAFVITSKRYGIGRELVRPFFKSMRMDIKPKAFSKHLYSIYIYGSAEVIGLMCLRVFCDDNETYKKLEQGAQALGSAYQKVNFLRDMKADYEERGRVYFPGVDYDKFNDRQKDIVIKDIRKDFEKAKLAVNQLPKNARKAVTMSYMYYSQLLDKLDRASADDIKAKRLRLNAPKKALLYIRAHSKLGGI
jgi:phytoene synthase